ncbi:MAG: ribonuclease Z [Patescibacteria group bacterium]
MGLKVTALGTGVCVNGIKDCGDRQPPGFLVEVDGFYVLFDCSEGIRFRLQAAGIDYGLVAHVAVTHAHADHAALPQFIQSKLCRHIQGDRDPRTGELKIYLPKILARDFPQVWNWHQPENDGGYWNEFAPEIIGMEDGFVDELKPGIKLKAYNVYHGFGRHPSMGFRLETKYGCVAYTGDAGVCEGIRVIAQSADLLIADCQVRIGQEYTGGYGHMGPRQCGDLALKSGAKRLWLVHFPGQDTPEAMLAEVRASGYFGTTAVAQDGEAWGGGKE